MKTIYSLLAFIFFSSSPPANAQWVQQTLPGDINATLGIDFINENHGIMGGWYGEFSEQVYGKAYYTYDGGGNWFEASIPDSMRVLIEVQMINDTLSYGAGAYNVPGGGTSLFQNQDQFQNLNPAQRKYYEQIGMDFSGDENYRGYFVETTDGGLNWHPKGSFEDSVYYLDGMFFIDALTGFVIAQSYGTIYAKYAILKTVDGGNNWYFVYPFEELLWLKDIEFINSLHGIAVGKIAIGSGTGVIFRSTDGGETWNEQYVTGLTDISRVKYIDTNTIVIIGVNSLDQFVVYKSTDNGISWQEIRTYNGFESIRGVDVVQDSSYILVYGFEVAPIIVPIVDISLDGGISWNYSQLSQFQDYLPRRSKMVDELRWYLTGTTPTFQAGFVLFTDNSGGIPVELISFSAESVNSKVHLKWTTATELNNLGFEIERKTDEEDWRRIGFVEGKGTTTEIQNYRFTDDLFRVKPGQLYYRLKQVDYNGTYEYSNVVEIISSPKSLHLSQNFPNPFNPSTSIQYAISSRQFVSLKVYDVLGNEIVTLVNEEKPAGEYEVEFNAKGLPSGIYFYRLNAGSYSSTKKMILLR